MIVQKFYKYFFILLDAPHLIKLARNHLLDKGFFLPPDSDKHRATLNKADFQKLLDVNSGETYKTLFKLNQNHIDLVGHQKQRVRLATQLLSHSVARSFLHQAHLFTSERDAKAKHDAVKLFNDW